MSIEFNRRTFLKTGAVLAGATALVGLTGCGSSSSSSDSHPINKVVTDSQTFDVGGITVDPDNEGSISGALGHKVYSIDFTVKASSEAKLYNDAVSLYYKGNSVLVTIKVGTALLTPPFTITAGEAQVTFSCDVPDDAVYSDIIVKLHYKEKSIKFQNIDSSFKTSGVYADKL